MLKNIIDIKHTFYINLKSRPDRKEHFEKELKKVGIQEFTRFNAIKLHNGAIGCSMSHLKCLEIAKQNNWQHVLICEDDIEFLEPEIFKQQFNKFLESTIQWDVVLLAGNNVPPYQKINDSCVKVTRCQTTTAYLVQNHYYDILIQNIKDGIQKLIKEPEKHVFFAIDKYWFSLQQKDNWYLIIPLTVVQRIDYSDIEKKMTNYKRAMTDLEKEYLFQQTFT
jgi:glycosyl transferase family 25